MSKIYEALLRAEQDRAEDTREGFPIPDAAHSQRTAVAVDVAVANPYESATAARAAYVPAASSFATPMEPAVPSHYVISAAAQVETPVTQSPIFSEKAEQVSVWHPDIAKLPALESRGNQVEQFRSLRSKLFEFRDLNKLKSILVSSGLPAEGKSFVATNLAVTFARHKSARVLLIDGDLRRSSQHKALGAPNKPGLSDYLAGKASPAEIMYRGTSDEAGTALPIGLATLTFIPAGEAGDKAADLSGSPRFAELMKMAAPLFDWIIVDSSPVNLVTDAVNLARSCDGVLLIARGGVTKYEAAQRALAELKASKMLGIVLNAVADPPTADGYYGYDNYDSPQA